MDKIAVIIPCYNESKTIEKCIKDWKQELPEATIYVYDNNSIDHTDEIATNAGAIVRYEHMQGKGNVIRRMFREIDALCYIMVDGDDTYPAEYGREMANLVLDKHVDMVIGDRLSSTYFNQNKRPFHNFGNKLVRWSINKIFHADIRDIMTGYRAFSYQFVKTFPVLSQGFEIETEMTIHAIDKNMFIKNVIIDYRDRPKGSNSKLNTFKDGFKVLYTICKFCRDYRPLLFWGTIANILVFLSLLFLLPILVYFHHTGLVPRIPTLITCCFTLLVAIQSYFTGLQLQTIYLKNRQDFEMELIRCFDEMKRK